MGLWPFRAAELQSSAPPENQVLTCFFLRLTENNPSTLCFYSRTVEMRRGGGQIFIAAAVQALVPLGSPPALCFSHEQFPHSVDSFFHVEHAASTLGPESYPEGNQLFRGQSYIKRFWVGGVVLECHNSVSPKNWKRFAFYSESHLVSLGFCSTQARCGFAVSRGGFQVQICSVQ